MLSTLVIAGIGGVTIGSFAAALADVFPAYRRGLGGSGGGLLVGGVTLLGLALSFV